MKGIIVLQLFSVLVSSVLAKNANKLHKFGNREYYIEPEYKYNWFEADSECARKNMSLITIDTKPKSIEVHNLLKSIYKKNNIPRLFIGANDLGNFRKFVWILTGQPFSFTNWERNEPNNHKTNERCVHIGWYGNDLWNDEPCNAKFGFICEDCNCK